jgi:hypothetical protein
MQTPTLHADDAKLKPYEPAARIYCRKVDMDPDYVVDVPHPSIAGVAVATPFWMLVAEKMVDLSLMLTSIREAATAANDPSLPS